MTISLPRIPVISQLIVLIRAWAVKYFRTRYLLRQWQIAHAAELTRTPINMVPYTLARQASEIAAVRAGKAGSAVAPDITERRSWQWPYLPASINRLSVPILKAIPYNLRRMSRTPVPRRAINQIKGALVARPFEIRPIDGVPVKDADEQKKRIRIAEKLFRRPNSEDSFQTFLEQGLEDYITLGGFVAELRLTPDPLRPLKLWPVNIESIRLFVSWKESAENMPRYAQMTGMKGERGAILFFDDELLYLKDNQSTDNPFGLGKMEVAFASVNAFLGVQDMAGRAGADQVHKCFPGDTEVLTRRGWVRWCNVLDDDEFATRSPDNLFQWQRALGFVREWHDGDMIRFRNRSQTITVTPNHRMYGRCVHKDRRSGKRTADDCSFVEAVSLYEAAANRPGKGWRYAGHSDPTIADFRIPAQTIWEDGVLSDTVCRVGSRVFTWEDWAAFLGIWIAEGSCLGSGNSKAPVVPPDTPSNGEYRIQIAQSRSASSSTYAWIGRLLTRMGIVYTASCDRYVFSDRDIWEYLIRYGNSHTKYVPQWVKDAPVHIIRTYIDWAVLGDGSVRKYGKRVYYTASERLAGDMQELFQKSGTSASVRLYRAENGNVLYIVTEMLHSDISILPAFGRDRDRMPERIPYSDYVYCAMVPNGTLYCREQGYAFWSGNTWLWWEAPQSDAAYQIVRRHIQNELEGQAKISIIGGMKKPDVLEVTPVTNEDILLPWQEMLIRMIANAFDMSAMSLGVEHDVNRAVGQVLDDRDFRTAVVPTAMRIAEGFTRRILHNKLGWTDLEFVFKGLDDPDIETKVAILGRLYAMNAQTPNRILRSLNMEPLTSPLADLTQHEAMLLNIEAMNMSQDQLAQHAADRQAKQMQQQGGGGFMQRPSPGAVSRGGQPPNPRAMSLPKFPVPGGFGGNLSAREIEQMPLNQMQDVLDGSGLTAAEFIAALDTQEPGILERLSDEVRDFLKGQLDDEQDDVRRTRQIPQKMIEHWRKNLSVRVRKDKRRNGTYTDYLYNRDAAQRAVRGRKPRIRPGQNIPRVDGGI